MPQTSLPAACIISIGRITAARNRSSKKISWEDSNHHSAFLTYQVVCRRKRKTAGKTRSSLPTDQRRRNTTIPGMASRSEGVQQARHSPPGKKTRIKVAADPLQPPQESPTTPHQQKDCTWELSYFTPKMAELLPSSTRGHGTLEKESTGGERTV